MSKSDDLETDVATDEVEAVWRLVLAFARSVTSDDVVAVLFREGERVAGATVADVALRAKDGASIRLVQRAAVEDAALVSSHVALEEPLPSCEAITGGLPVVLASLEEVARRYPILIREMTASGLEARASVPLCAAAGEILGAVSFTWTEPQEFSGTQLLRLDLVAQLAGLALDRAGERATAALPNGLFGLETMPSAFFSLDAELRLTYVNAETERLLDIDRDDLIGRDVVDLIPGVAESTFALPYRRALEIGRPVTFEEFYSSLGGWFEVHVWPDRHGLNVSLWNIDERHIDELRRTLALNEAERAKIHLTLLNELSAQLRTATTRLEIFERLADTVVPTMASWCTVVVPEGDELVRVAARHRDPVLDGLAKRLVGSYPHKFSGPSPGVVAYKSGEPLRLERLAQNIVEDLDDSAASAAYGRTLMLLGDGPGLIVPIHSRGAVVAVLTMVRPEHEDFDDADVVASEEVAGRIAVALDGALHLEIERATAGALQAAALPKSLPTSDRIALAAGYRAASEGSQVGGDWYDAIELSEDRIALVVGDAAGHGLQAAALMAQMRNALRAYLVADQGPSEALDNLRRLVALQEPEAFATIICLEIDLVRRSLVWASAGHPSPVLVRKDGTSSYLRGRPAPPIGWTDGDDLGADADLHLGLAEGDRLFLFSDGLVERRGIDLDIGITHLMILAEQTRSMGDLTDACDAIFSNMLSARHEDDVCLLIAELR